MNTISHAPYDVAVVGAGIVGLAVAREILARRPDARLVVIDKQTAVAQHQTGHNSGVIHSGIYYTPGSLKARLCVEGARLMYEYCDEHAIPYERCGKLVVALDDAELPRLDALEARARANGVPGLRRVTAAEIREIEPEARGLSALHSPETGIVDFAEVARTIERELRGKGVDFALGHEVTGVRRTGGQTVVECRDDVFRAGWAVLCAGLWSDRLAVSAGAPPDPRVLPFRGAYLRVAEGQAPLVRGMIYPVPDPDLPFLGVHVTKHIDGHVSLGPTAMLVGSRDGAAPDCVPRAGTCSPPLPGPAHGRSAGGSGGPASTSSGWRRAAERSSRPARGTSRLSSRCGWTTRAPAAFAPRPSAGTAA